MSDTNDIIAPPPAKPKRGRPPNSPKPEKRRYAAEVKAMQARIDNARMTLEEIKDLSKPDVVGCLLSLAIRQLSGDRLLAPGTPDVRD